jgi:predicted MFS family arabinose efflux permease
MTADAHPTTPVQAGPSVTERHRRLLIAVFSLSSSMAYIAMIQMIPVVLTSMADDLGSSRAAIAGASTVSTLVGALVAIPTGRILDRFGGRMVMTVGALIGVLAVVLWSQSTSLPTLYSSFVLIGFSTTACTYEAAFAVLVFATNPATRDRAIIAVAMIAGLLTYLVYPVLGWMNTELGWRDSLLVLATLLAATAVPGHWLAIPSRNAHREQVAHRAGVPAGSAVRQGRFWLLLVAFVGQAGSAAAFLLMMIAYLQDVGYPPVAATAMPVAIGIMQITSRLVLTAFADRIHIVSAAVVAFVIQAVGLLSLPMVGLSIPLCVLCVGAVGVGQGIAIIARPTILADTFGAAHFASVLAVLTVPIALARASMPVVAAWLADWRFLTVSGVLALVAAAALLPLRANRRVPQPSPT